MSSIVGKIYSLSCENFVTYDKITVFPGEYLNLIIGPNGTGKSTLVAAIVLGLGGEPKLLSRATNIRDYVKNGKEKSWIEIAIYVDENRRQTRYRRSFDLSGKSMYSVDGKTVTQGQYLKLIAQYNIQISNLCQFMPQDRVQDFAKMNPQELLNSTQEAISTPEMIQHFAKLKELRNIQRTGGNTLLDNQKRLKELEERNAQLKDIIEKVKIREKFINDIEIGKKKKLWLEFDEIQKDLDKMSEIMKKAQYDVTRDEKIFKDMQNLSKDIIATREKLSRNATNEANNVTKLSAQLDKLEESLAECEDTILTAERNLNSKKTDMAERENEIVQANRLLEGYVQDLRVATESISGSEFKKELASYNADIEGKRAEIRNLNERRIDINHEIDHYQPELNSIRNRINRIQNEGERRLNKLRQLNTDAYTGVQWLRKNRHIFEGHVYEPLILELRVKKPSDAKYIENTVARRDLLAFVCTQKEDVNLLIQKLCNEQHLKINVLHSDPAEQCQYRADTPISHLKKWGFYSYLLDMIEGPAPILNYLCKAYQIHKTLVASDEVENHVERLPRDIRLFFSSQNRFQIIVSKYSGEASSVCSRISEQNLLCADIDETQLDALNGRLQDITRTTDQLKNNRNNIEAKINQCNEQVNVINKMKAKLEGKMLAIRDIKRNVKDQEQKIARLKRDEIDIEQETENFKTICNQTIQKMISTQRRKVKCFEEYQAALEKKEYAKARLLVYSKETVDIENQLKTAEDEYKTAKQRYEKLQKTEQEVVAKRNAKESEALASCNGKHRNDRKFPFREQFAELPDNLEELEEHLVEMNTRADCMNEYQADITNYKQQLQEIDHLRRIINSAQTDQSKLSSDIDKIHEIWYPYFTEKINRINESFAKFMSRLEYAGEVNLTHTAPNDYDTYGIQILVQYRNNAKLQALDRFIQSGGERAVAIALYSMTLQSLTHVPFRCVDEINQGMDPKNERKVFNLIVDETCQEGSSQYFFVTPKLLPDLKSSELLTAIIVFNGNLSSPDIFNNAVK